MKIAVCIKQGGAAKRIIALAHTYAPVFKAEVHLITAYGQRDDVREKDADNMLHADQFLEVSKQHLLDAGIPCVSKLLVNELSPGENILSYARNHEIDLIIIGVGKTSRLGKAIFGSTTQYVILNAACPVTCLR